MSTNEQELTFRSSVMDLRLSSESRSSVHMDCLTLKLQATSFSLTSGITDQSTRCDVTDIKLQSNNNNNSYYYYYYYYYY
jgi:hypothetical protein